MLSLLNQIIHLPDVTEERKQWLLRGQPSAASLQFQAGLSSPILADSSRSRWAPWHRGGFSLRRDRTTSYSRWSGQGSEKGPTGVTRLTALMGPAGPPTEHRKSSLPWRERKFLTCDFFEKGGKGKVTFLQSLYLFLLANQWKRKQNALFYLAFKKEWLYLREKLIKEYWAQSTLQEIFFLITCESRASFYMLVSTSWGCMGPPLPLSVCRTHSNWQSWALTEMLQYDCHQLWILLLMLFTSDSPNNLFKIVFYKWSITSAGRSQENSLRVTLIFQVPNTSTCILIFY